MDVVISANSIHKHFRLSNRSNSIKAIFTNLFVRKATRPISHSVLNGVTFNVKKGEFFGIVGRNGSGKSTILKILAGIYQPTSGKIRVTGRLVPFIELGIGFNSELTGRDNVYLNGAILGFSKSEIDGMYKAIVDFAELGEYMDEKLKNYSSGMQVRLAFSLAIRVEADILLIDEVLAVGDASFQKKCYNYFNELKHSRKTVILISHDMDVIKSYCDRAILIEGGKVVSEGSVDDVSAAYNKLLNIIPNTNMLATKRWGNGSYIQEKVTVLVNDKQLIINAYGIVQKDLDELIAGIQIYDHAGTEIIATNTKMLMRPDMLNLKRGDKLAIRWTIDNVFSSGQYHLSLAYVDRNEDTLDWIHKCASFRVKKIQSSATPILPDMDLRVSITQGAN